MLANNPQLQIQTQDKLAHLKRRRLQSHLVFPGHPLCPLTSLLRLLPTPALLLVPMPRPRPSRRAARARSLGSRRDSLKRRSAGRVSPVRVQSASRAANASVSALLLHLLPPPRTRKRKKVVL